MERIQLDPNKEYTLLIADIASLYPNIVTNDAIPQIKNFLVD